MAQSAKVLLVEADSISTQLLSFSLKREGFEVIGARSGPEGLRLARERQIDIVLSEVLLPDMDGYELCRQLRADWNTRRIPIVLVTSFGGTENRVQGMLAGADDYFVKPYDVRELVVRLHRLISTYSNCAQINPITELPCSQVIQSYMEEVCLYDRERKWALLHIDINHFTAFNQIYGFETGNCVLSMAAGVLREVVLDPSPGPAFVAHDGRDDFVAVVTLDRAQDVCRQLISEFDKHVPECYPAEHREGTYHVLIDRAGKTQLVPRLTLSIGVVTSDLCDSLSYLEIREAGSDVVRRAKIEEKSAAYANRRHLVGRRVGAPLPGVRALGKAKLGVAQQPAMSEVEGNAN